MKSFTLNTEYIELIKLLKYMHLAQNGAHAKMLVEDEMVLVNGEVELRKRRKLVAGDVVTCDGTEIKIETDEE